MTMPFTFVPLARSDFELLGSWLAAPHVRRWWNDDPSPRALEADYGGCIDGVEPAQVFIAWHDGDAVGMIQRYRFGAYPAYIAEMAHIVDVAGDTLGIDYLIGPTEALGKGLGTAMITNFLQRTWHEDPLAPFILIPVQSNNRRSWRALERSGFTRIAQGELTPDNPLDHPLHFIYSITRP